MAFYDGLGKRIQQSGQGAIDRTRKNAEVTRINTSIDNLEKDMSNDYKDLGRTYYQKYAAGGTDDPDMIPYFEKLNAKMNQLEEYKEQIRNLKGIRRCVNCGMDIRADAAYCNYCGAKQPSIAETSQMAERICPTCGAVLEADQIFCTVCGTNVKDIAATPIQEAPAQRCCVQCGQPLDANAVFCPNCGQRNEIPVVVFEEEVTDFEPEMTQPDPQYFEEEIIVEKEPASEPKPGSKK